MLSEYDNDLLASAYNSIYDYCEERQLQDIMDISLSREEIVRQFDNDVMTIINNAKNNIEESLAKNNSQDLETLVSRQAYLNEDGIESGIVIDIINLEVLSVLREHRNEIKQLLINLFAEQSDRWWTIYESIDRPY